MNRSLIIVWSCLASVLFLDACSTPQTQVRALYTIKERITLGEHKVIVYRIADSLSAFSRYRYVPVYRFDILGDKGEVRQQYIGAVQEYLSRVAGRLRPEQKNYLQALPLKTTEEDSLLATVTWSVPNIEGEVSDVQDASTVIKTRYWSLDKTTPKGAEEVFSTEVLSVPYHDKALRSRRTINEALQLFAEGENNAYFEFKRYVLAHLGE